MHSPGGRTVMRMVAPPVIRLSALVAVALGALAMACGGSSSIEDAEEVVVAERIEFRIPGAMDEVGVNGIDSVVGLWESADLSLLLDYGASSDSLGYNTKEGYKQTFTTIAGRPAVIERFMDPGADATRPYVAAIHFEDAGDGKKLTIFGRAASEDDQELLMDVYETLKWLEPKDA